MNRKDKSLNKHCQDIADISSPPLCDQQVRRPSLMLYWQQHHRAAIVQHSWVSNVFEICINQNFQSINSVKMNAKFSLPLVILLSHLSSPCPWYYHGLCPHHHGFTVDFIPISAVTFIPITTVLPQLPRIYHCPYPHAALYRQPRPVCTRVHCASLQPTQLNTRQRMDTPAQ